MLDDISHWVFLALASPVTLEISYTDRFDSVLRSQLAILKLISRRMDETEELLQRIAASPKVQVKKEYYLSSSSFRREDPVSLRWAARNPGESCVLASRNVISHDVYENHFILFFLNQLERRLVFLQHVTDRTVRDKDAEIRRERSYSSQNLVQRLEEQKQKAVELQNRCLALQARLGLLRNLEFLKDVIFIPSQFRLIYSLALTQDFNYSRVFALYRELGRDEEVKRLDRVRSFVDGLTALGVEANWRIYEYWTFFALRSQLVALRFHPQDDRELLQMIVSDVLDPRLESGRCITLVGDNQIYDSRTIRLYYNQAYRDGNGRELARPDVTMEIWQRGRLIARFIFDAKYKTYTAAMGKNSKDWFWEKDFFRASTRYQDGDSVNGGVIDKSQGVFLLHINTQDEWLENYGAFIQGAEGAPLKVNAHRFGFIPVVPGKLTQLRMLLGMIFLVKLQLQLDICWTCGSTEVRQEPYRSQYGKEQANKRVCQKCGHEWWVSQCSCGFPLFKGNFSFQVQHRAVQPSCQCDGYVCPGCGKCVCGKQVVSV